MFNFNLVAHANETGDKKLLSQDEEDVKLK
jgi:hypothetical protein